MLSVPQRFKFTGKKVCSQTESQVCGAPESRFASYIREKTEQEAALPYRARKSAKCGRGGTPTKLEQLHKTFIPQRLPVRKVGGGEGSKSGERQKSWQLPQGWSEICDLIIYFHGEQSHIWNLQCNFSQH